MPPTKRLRVGSATVNAEVNETDVTVTDPSGEGSLFHNRIHLSDPTNTHIARVRLNGSTMEVGPSTATTLALQTGGTTRATVNASTGQVAVTNGIASTSATTGALVITGGLGVSGQIWGTARIQTGGPIATTSTTGSSNTGTGALTVGGGVGVTQNIYAGGVIVATGSMRTDDATASTSATTGALRSAGGLGVVGDANIGGYIRGLSGIASQTAQAPFVVDYGYTTPAASSGTVTFSRTFSAAPTVVTGMTRSDGGTVSICVKTISTTQFTWNSWNLGGGAATCNVNWIAIGLP